MHFKDIFFFAMKNVWRTRKRKLLTAISVCIGIASVVLISSLGYSATEIVEAEIEKMGISGITVYSNNRNVTLNLDDISYISKNIDSVKNVQPFLIEYGAYQIKGTRGNSLLWGVDKNIEEVIAFQVLHGRKFTASDIKQKKKVAIIDNEFAKKIYVRENIVGKEIILNIASSAERFEIIGVISSQKDGVNKLIGGAIPEFVYIPYTTLIDMRGNNNINQIAIRGFNDETNKETGKKCVEALSRIKRVNKNTFGFENMSEHSQSVKKLANFIALVISAIAAISLIVAGLDIVSTTVAATFERRREIGIMMATGAECRDITLWFVCESCITAAVGGVLGIFIGLTLMKLISYFFNLPFIVKPLNLFMFQIIAIMCGGIFALVPAYRAARKPPIETLRE